MAKIIGEVIRQKIREDGRTAQVICDELGMSRGNLDKIYHKDSLNTDLLAKLCGVLNYDFFLHVNPFRVSEINKVRQLHPYTQGNHVAEEQAVYHTPGDQIGKCLHDLDLAHRDLNFLQQSLDDVKSSIADKDEIISLQKDKIKYLTEVIEELRK